MKVQEARMLYAHPESVSKKYASVLCSSIPDLGAKLPCVLIPCANRKQARAVVRVANTAQPDLVVEMAMALRKEHGKYKQRGRIRNYIKEAYAIIDALGLWRGRG